MIARVIMILGDWHSLLLGNLEQNGFFSPKVNLEVFLYVNG